MLASSALILCSNDPQPPVRAVLAGAGLEVALHSLEGDPVDGTAAKLVLIDGADAPQALRLCQRLRRQFDDAYVPILFLAGATTVDGCRAALEADADACLPWPTDAASLVAQVQTLLRLKERHDQLALKAADAQRLNQRLQAANQQMNQELELARRVQESFLPHSLPDLPQARFAVAYKPCGRVGGDFYDVFRLDEQHLGLYVADAMGHGVPASLLTIFVKKGVKSKEIDGQSYRLVPPDEVLHKLNHDMMAQALSETPFITMVYGLFNYQTGRLQLSRAGHPYPVHIPREGPPSLWQMEGSLLGVFETHYRTHEQRLGPGDKMLFYTDGIDAGAHGTHAVGLTSLLAAAEAHRRLRIDELVQRLATDLFHQTRQTDDVTVLGLEVPG